jgi:hypothetical protein
MYTPGSSSDGISAEVITRCLERFLSREDDVLCRAVTTTAKSLMPFLLSRYMGTNTIRMIARCLTTAAGNELPGTAPPHRLYILLHTSNPPAEYAPRISSKVQRALQLNILKLGGLVNFSWSADQPVFSNAGGVQETETYAATAFSLFGRLDIPSLSLQNMDQVVEKLRRHADAPSVTHTSNDVHLYVCTHGARDCRCGDRGQPLVTALREEVARRNLKQVRVGEVGHVGGHK